MKSFFGLSLSLLLGNEYVNGQTLYSQFTCNHYYETPVGGPCTAGTYGYTASCNTTEGILNLYYFDDYETCDAATDFSGYDYMYQYSYGSSDYVECEGEDDNCGYAAFREYSGGDCDVASDAYDYYGGIPGQCYYTSSSTSYKYTCSSSKVTRSYYSTSDCTGSTSVTYDYTTSYYADTSYSDYCIEIICEGGESGATQLSAFGAFSMVVAAALLYFF
jgi:hypothetical protein